MKRALKLQYTIQFGELAPYAAAVAEGRALASTCRHCGFTAFPPRVICPTCQRPDFAWQQLSGEARILHRTAGNERAFGLAQFAGASTQTVVRLHAIPDDAPTGRLIAPRDELIGLWLGADTPDARKGH